ncbi:MAG: chemotaxis protein [Clostridiales bacterium]|jgi:two-component system chemotaxis response regulator CheV|nr:chemotaxis protein [Clostridiales bacterium]
MSVATLKKQEILLETGTNELEIMEFTIDGKHFGINVAKVTEIMQYQNITSMPNSNQYVEGIFKPRDMIMVVINLGAYLNLNTVSDDERDILIITNFNKTSSAFHVHSVEAIHRISWSNIEKPDKAIYGTEDGLATGIARLENRLITILDFEKIIADICPEKSIQLSDLKVLGKRQEYEKPIMVVEDSPLLEKLIVEALHQSGYANIECFLNGEEAWEKLLQYRKNNSDDLKSAVSCIITDIEMPRMDGLRLTKLINSDPTLQVIPVIIFSSLITEEMRNKCRSVGSVAEISKPEIGRLIKLIDQYSL